MSPELPQLKRIVLFRVDGKHTPPDLVDGLRSKLSKEIRLELLDPLPEHSEPRIAVELKLSGEWLAKETGEIVIALCGEYEARFVFKGSPSMKQVETWLDDELYRTSLIAQAYIPANSHFCSQLELMGLRAGLRPIGYLAEGEFQKLDGDSEKPRRRRTKARTKPVKSDV